MPLLQLITNFDFSWKPNPKDPPYIYQYGTQHQKTGGPRYIVPVATKLKYVDTRVLKARKLPTKKNWEIPATIDVSKFDFSWHPDDTAGPVIYQFGTIADPNNGPRYMVEGATEIVNLEQVKKDIFVEQSQCFSKLDRICCHFHFRDFFIRMLRAHKN